MLENFEQTKEKVEQVVEKAISLARELKDNAFADSLQDHLREMRNARFKIAIVGSIKRGKSTLINTLLGRDNDDLSPVARKTCTGCVVHYMDVAALPEGEPRKPHAKVFIKGAETPKSVPFESLRDYINEENNKDNWKNVSHVEVYGEFPLLRSCCIVDTPGTDAVIKRHGEVVTEFLPTADAIIMTTMSDMAMTDNDRRMVNLLSKESQRRIFYVLTQVDSLRPSQLPMVQKYVMDQIEKYGLARPGELYSVACKKVFEALCNHESRETVDSLRSQWGVQHLESALESFILQNSNTAAALRNRVESILKRILEFLTNKKDTNDELLKMQAVNIEEVETSRKIALDDFGKMEEELRRKISEFEQNWKRQTNRSLSDLESKILPKLKDSVEMSLKKAGTLEAIGNLFSLSEIVKKVSGSVIDEFMQDTEPKFEKLIERLNEDYCSTVDFYVKKNSGSQLSGSIAGIVLSTASGAAITGGLVAAGGVVGAAATAATGGIPTFLAALFGKGAVSALGASLSAAVIPVLLAYLAYKLTGPFATMLGRWLSGGNVEAAAEQAKTDFIEQSKTRCMEIVEDYSENLAKMRRDLESKMQELDEKLRNWTPEMRESVVRENETISALLDDVKCAAEVAADI